MKNGWRWVIGIVLGLVLIGFLWAGRSSRQAYRVARGAINARVEFAQDRIDFAEEMAIATVDLALKLAGDLPIEGAEAEHIKEHIGEISDLLKEAVDLRGQAAVDKLDQAIEQFNHTLETVEEASQNAEVPAIKSQLDRLYGVLLAAQEALTQFLFTGRQ